MSIQTYERNQLNSLKGRDLEAMVFSKATTLLQEALKNPSNKDMILYALNKNQQLWTIIQNDVRLPENTLANDLKANLISLSLFVDRQTNRAVISCTPEDIEPLIEINKNIALGLRNSPQ